MNIGLILQRCKWYYDFCIALKFGGLQVRPRLTHLQDAALDLAQP